MFLFFAVIAAALVIAVLIGGDVRRLSQVRIRHIELLLAAFASKVAVALLGTAHTQIAVTVARPLNVIGAVLLVAVVWFNRRIPGAMIFGAGLTLTRTHPSWLCSEVALTRCTSPSIIRRGSGSLATSSISPASAVIRL